MDETTKLLLTGLTPGLLALVGGFLGAKWNHNNVLKQKRIDFDNALKQKQIEFDNALKQKQLEFDNSRQSRRDDILVRERYKDFREIVDIAYSLKESYHKISDSVAYVYDLPLITHNMNRLIQHYEKLREYSDKFERFPRYLLFNSQDAYKKALFLTGENFIMTMIVDDWIRYIEAQDYSDQSIIEKHRLEIMGHCKKTFKGYQEFIDMLLAEQEFTKVEA